MDNLVFANGAPPGRLNFQGCTPGYPASLSRSVSNWATDSVFQGKSGPVWIGISGPVYSGMTGPVCSGTGGPLCSGIGGRMPPESAGQSETSAERENFGSNQEAFIDLIDSVSEWARTSLCDMYRLHNTPKSAVFCKQ
jgi:hypothetical protein